MSSDTLPDSARRLKLHTLSSPSPSLRTAFAVEPASCHVYDPCSARYSSTSSGVRHVSSYCEDRGDSVELPHRLPQAPTLNWLGTDLEPLTCLRCSEVLEDGKQA